MELNIRQLILSDLASNIGEVKPDTAAADNVLSAIDLITSKVETRAIETSEVEENGVEEDSQEPLGQRVFMVCLYCRANLLCPLTLSSPTRECNATSVSQSWQ